MNAAPIQIVEAAKGEYARAVDRLSKALSFVPDDKLHWSPGPSARTPLQIVAHCALATTGFTKVLQGEPMDFSNIPALDAQWRQDEKAYDTRDKVMALVSESTTAYNAYLDSLTQEKLDSVWDSPMGPFPMTGAITFMADHMRQHCSQLDYLQTCYGDMDWHF